MIWIDTGLSIPGLCLASAILAGDLYVTDSSGKLFKSVGGTGAFAQVAPALAGGVISGMLVFSGKVYGWAQNLNKLYEFNGVNAWVNKGTATGAGGSPLNTNMCIRGGELYAAVSGHLDKWDGVSVFTLIKNYGAGAVELLWAIRAAVDNNIYLGNDQGELYQWNGVIGVRVAPGLNGMSYANPVEYNNLIYAGMQEGRLYKWNGLTAWTQVLGAFDADVTTFAPPIVKGGRIYAVMSEFLGTTGGQLLSWATGEGAWTQEAATATVYTKTFTLFELNGSVMAMLAPSSGTIVSRLFRLGTPAPAAVFPLGVL